jgi:hypothetical protein
LENKAALSLLPERLASLAEMDWEERQVNLATGQTELVIYFGVTTISMYLLFIWDGA